MGNENGTEIEREEEKRKGGREGKKGREACQNRRTMKRKQNNRQECFQMFLFVSRKTPAQATFYSLPSPPPLSPQPTYRRTSWSRSTPRLIL